MTDRDDAIKTARLWLEKKPLYLDTETTGLDEDAEVCDIAVIDYDGVVLFETLVKPLNGIPPEATEIHGIRNEMVEDAPAFDDIAGRLLDVLRGRQLLIYNANFDLRIMKQSTAYPDRFTLWKSEPFSASCVMHLYARFFGDFNDYHRSYRWQSLANAAAQCGIELPHNLHRARCDAKLTRQIVMYIAGAVSDE